MVTLVVFLNLFFTPTIALWVHRKRRNEELKPSLRTLVQYAIFCACNVPLTKVGVSLFRKILHRDIWLDSGYYTLLAIMAAVVLPSLLDWVQAVYRERKALLEKGKVFLTKREMRYSQKLFASLLLTALIVIAYVLRGPLEIYAGNTHEFLFTLGDFLPWILTIGAVILVGAAVCWRASRTGHSAFHQSSCCGLGLHPGSRTCF